MYTNILIPTDGSELAGKAVEHGIALAKRIGAKVTALTVLLPFHVLTTDVRMIEDTPAQYKARNAGLCDNRLALRARARVERPARPEPSPVEIGVMYLRRIDENAAFPVGEGPDCDMLALKNAELGRQKAAASRQHLGSRISDLRADMPRQ